METKKVVVAHPNQQHSMELATALNNIGILDAYITTVFYKENSPLAKLLSSLSKGWSKKISRKQRESLDKKTHIRYRILGDAFYFFLGRNQKLAYKIYVPMTKHFGIYVAKYAIKNHCDAVVMFDFTAVSCFQYLKKNAPNIKRILDMSSIPGGIIDEIISREENNGNGDMFVDKRCRYSKENCDYFDQELALADAFLSPSEFVDRALIRNNIEKSRIYRASYGVNLSDFKFNHKKANEDTDIMFVYAGKIEGAKGIHYLVDACDQVYRNRKDFKLHLVGPNYMKKELFEKREYIVEHGYLNKDELIALYQKMHVFVLPSLWEGKSLSVLEALSAGLCEIITSSSGVDEIVLQSSSGIVVPPQDSETLADAINWYLDHKLEISKISKNAGMAVGKMSWDNYYQDIQHNITKILCMKNKEPSDESFSCS